MLSSSSIQDNILNINPNTLENVAKTDLQTGIENALLGITENRRTFLSDSSRVDPLKKRAKTPQNKFRNNRRKRYALQNTARDILLTDSQRWSTEKCTRCTHGLNIKLNKKDDRSYYTNVITCKSVWTCPVCSSKISTARAAELETALKKTDYSLFMVTLTLSHKKRDALKTLMTDLEDSWRYVFAGANRERFTTPFESVGFIKALEIRHGANGWHPHLHILFMSKLSYEELHKQRQNIHNFINDRYCKALAKRGYKTNKHTVDTTVSADISNYLTKFSTELTYNHEKSGKSLSAFQILDKYQDTNDSKYADLFLEYAQATKRKQQLIYSNGLKDLLGIEQQSDDEIVDDSEEEVFSVFTKQQYSRITRQKMRCIVLDQSEKLQINQFCFWLVEQKILLLDEVQEFYKLLDLYQYVQEIDRLIDALEKDELYGAVL